jgi:hypothetical protein
VAGTRLVPVAMGGPAGMTIERCAQFCRDNFRTVFALQYGGECFIGERAAHRRGRRALRALRTTCTARCARAATTRTPPPCLQAMTLTLPGRQASWMTARAAWRAQTQTNCAAARLPTGVRRVLAALCCSGWAFLRIVLLTRATRGCTHAVRQRRVFTIPAPAPPADVPRFEYIGESHRWLCLRR